MGLLIAFSYVFGLCILLLALIIDITCSCVVGGDLAGPFLLAGSAAVVFVVAGSTGSTMRIFLGFFLGFSSPGGAFLFVKYGFSSH